jgi:dihydrodipicolinate reductase
MRLNDRHSTNCSTYLRIVVFVSVLVVGALVWAVLGNTSPSEETQTEVDYPVDFSDPRHLAGLADMIFVGRVVDVTGTETLDERMPETQYKVKIV